GTPEIAAVVPFESARRSFIIDEWNSLIILVKPKPEVSVSRAMDAATVTLRRLRGLRVGDANTFDLLTSDQVLSIFDSLTFAFFFVMLVLSSIALMVGGIGVMAIMMVSVTSRTREIGLRKALGATRRAILWQFLVEAATLTLLGGITGILLGVTCGGTLAKAVRAGHRVGILDLTQGEMGTRGDAATRAAEADRAAKTLGVPLRLNAAMPDAHLENNEASREQIVAIIRRTRPRVVILPYSVGRHPDHRIASELGRDACYLAGLAKDAP